MPSLASHPSAGTGLLHQLQRDLPALSPKLQSVALFCIQHASTLHRYRVKDVAEACGTIPASVVRLAQRFGLKGFQEMKVSFLDRSDRETVSIATSIAETPPPWLDPECLAALQDIEDSALGLASLKGLALTPEFHYAVHSLRTAAHIRFDWAGDEDRIIALHLQSRMRAAGCRQVETQYLDAVSESGWLVQVAVWNDLTPDSKGLGIAACGPHVLRLVRGRMNRFASRTHEGVDIRVGTDARRMLNALALCEALATAVKPDTRPLT